MRKCVIKVCSLANYSSPLLLFLLPLTKMQPSVLLWLWLLIWCLRRQTGSLKEAWWLQLFPCDANLNTSIRCHWIQLLMWCLVNKCPPPNEILTPQKVTNKSQNCGSLSGTKALIEGTLFIVAPVCWVYFCIAKSMPQPVSKEPYSRCLAHWEQPRLNAECSVPWNRFSACINMSKSAKWDESNCMRF